MAEGYVLSESDLQALREVIEDYRQRQGATTNRPAVQPPTPQAPEVYIARTPAGGIPAVTENTTGSGRYFVDDDVPGHADCAIYRLIDGVFVSMEMTRRVYNISMLAIDAGRWIVVMRDKTGTWLVPNIGRDFAVCP